MKTKLAKLIDVKSIMTLLLTIVFCVLALLGVITADQFVTIFTVVVGFYFGTQSAKKKETGGEVEAMKPAMPESNKPPDLLEQAEANTNADETSEVGK